MKVLVILYRSGLELARVKDLFRERAGRYQRVPGLLEKLYVHDPATGHLGGLYIFENEESLNAFRGSDLERSITAAYAVTDGLSMRVFDLVRVIQNAPLADR